MKRISLMLSICCLAFVGCQKEQVKQGEIRYTDFYVRSPKDSSKLITIEEYNKIMESMPTEKEDSRGRNWIDCFYDDGTGVWKKGKTCSGTTTQGCTEPFGCRGGYYGS